MKTNRTVSLLLALGLSLGALGGCTGQNTRVAAQYSGGEIPAGVYVYNAISAYNESISKVPDSTKDPLKQEIDGVKVPDWIANRALLYTKAYAVTETECTRLGITLEPTAEASIRHSISQGWEQDGPVLQKNGVERVSIESIAINAQKRVLLFDKIYGVGGEQEIPASELETYYQENYRRVLYLAFPKYDATTQEPLEGDALTARIAEIDAYFKRAQDGEKLFDLLVEYDKLQNADSTAERPALVESEQEVVLPKVSSYYPPAFLEAVFAGDKMNTIERFDAGEFEILYERRDLMGDRKDFDAAQDSIRKAIHGPDFEAMLAEKADASGFVFNQQMAKTFAPSKLDLK